jgi:hypothetical protein
MNHNNLARKVIAACRTLDPPVPALCAKLQEAFAIALEHGIVTDEVTSAAVAPKDE